MNVKPKLLDQVRAKIRLKHYNIRTEQAYVDWIRRYILFHDKRHPQEMGKPEVEQFLSHLAVERNVAASTQNQALSAILFLYKEALEKNIAAGWTMWNGPNVLLACRSFSPPPKCVPCWPTWKDATA